MPDAPIRLSICIQTHPARAALLTRLLVSLSPTNVLVAHDPDPDARPGPLRSYLRALELLPAWATHHLVIQDDALVCDAFVTTLLRAIAARPSDPLALFVGAALGVHGDRVTQAFGRGETFVALSQRSWTPAVALVWPRALVPGFLAFAADKASRRPLADDEVLGRYFRSERVEVLATVPSLVEHPDDSPSLIGRKTRGDRSAACFVQGDPLAIRWH